MNKKLIWISAFLFFLPIHSRALILELPPTLAPEVLSETVPFVFDPGELRAQDFSIKWSGPTLEGVEVRVGEESLEWVRVKDVFVIPRGRIIVETKNAQAGRILNYGYSQAFQKEGDLWRAEIPVVFFSGKENSVQVTLVRDGKTIMGTLGFEFQPQAKEREGQVMIDPSCSPFNVAPKDVSIKANSWIFVGCRLAYVEGDKHLTSSLEIYVIWDNVGQIIKVDGIDQAASSQNVWALRQRAYPGNVAMSADGGASKVTLTYSVAEKQHWAFLGVGVGPYSYSYFDSATAVNSYAPIMTLYGSFLFTELMRIVMFNATAFHSKFYSDLGIYLLTEQTRSFDKRLSFNLLLGLHGIVFKDGEKTVFKLGGPQGAELIFRDFLKRNHNLGLGAFIFPPIGGKAYYNVWLRWGTPSFFGELNYLAWQEAVDSHTVYSRSFGLTVGMPLARFF